MLFISLSPAAKCFHFPCNHNEIFEKKKETLLAYVLSSIYGAIIQLNQLIFSFDF